MRRGSPSFSEMPSAATAAVGRHLGNAPERQQEDDFWGNRNTGSMIEKLARLQPSVLACMRGSAWQGEGGAMLRRLGAALGA